MTMTANTETTNTPPVALVTGGSVRLGAAISRALHARGYRIAVHARMASDQTLAFVADLNDTRADSAVLVTGDLRDVQALQRMARQAIGQWGRLDALVNNASIYRPTPLATLTVDDYNDILDTNLRAPLLLVQSCSDALRTSGGCVVNLIDVYAERSLANHPAYIASKAGLAGLTRTLARDLAPQVRVNGVSPGAILWPSEPDAASEACRHAIIARTPLERCGEESDIARAVVFLVADAPFITGHILPVDGGRGLLV